jgi:DNA-directed RNA polymerase beta' subunit
LILKVTTYSANTKDIELVFDILEGLSIREEINKVHEVREKVKALPHLSSLAVEPPVYQILSGVLNRVGTKATKELTNQNGIYCTIAAGSKGNVFNHSQITSCVGQQCVGGRRIMAHSGRVLPSFDHKDRHPRAEGFVSNSYTSGLTPTEFFFHAMGGREGLVDTAVKTADFVE